MEEINFIEEAKNITEEDFIEKYKNPFLISFENINQESNMKVSTSLIDIESILNNKDSKGKMTNIFYLSKKSSMGGGKKIYLGRSSTMDLVIADVSISKMHAFFEKENDSWYITDRNSTNGTFLNGIQLEPLEKLFLKNLDIVSFSKFKFMIYSTKTAYDLFSK